MRAYGGKVICHDNPTATHIVILSNDLKTRDEVSEMLEDNLNLKVVKPDWIIDSVVDSRMRPEFEYDPFDIHAAADPSTL